MVNFWFAAADRKQGTWAGGAAPHRYGWVEGDCSRYWGGADALHAQQPNTAY